jgi:glycosyltransferase involved in cell wall biosynthesis
MVKEDKPLVTVGLPVFNGEKYLSRAIESILNQEHQNLSLIICDNASDDKTAEICQKYLTQDSRVTYYRNNTNIGGFNNFKKALDLSVSDYFMWAAHDDYFDKSFIGKTLKKLRQNENAFICVADIQFIDEYGKYRVDTSYKMLDTTGLSFPEKIRAVLAQMGSFEFYGLFRTERLKKIYKSMAKTRFGNDRYILLELLINGDIVKVPERLFFYYLPLQEKSPEEHMKNFDHRLQVDERAYTELYKGLYSFLLNYPGFSENLKNEIKEIFIDTLSTTNLDWMVRILNEHIDNTAKFKVFLKGLLAESQENTNIIAPGPEKRKLKIDLVLQATGFHSWNIREGWESALKKSGYLNRVFRPKANWVSPFPDDDDGLLDYLKNPEADVILLIGFDWHSQALHASGHWQSAWKNSPLIKIMYVQEAILEIDKITGNKASLCFKRALNCVDLVVFTSEPDFSLIDNTPYIWQPFSIDPDIFKTETEFSERINRAYFRGKNGKPGKPYEKRYLISEKLQKHGLTDIFDYQKLRPQELSAEFNRYRIAVNLPSSFCTGHTTRIPEAMAAGCTLITNYAEDEKANSLFKDKEHLFYYNPDNIEELTGLIEYCINNPGIAEKVAKQGNQLVMSEYTLEKRIAEIVKYCGTLLNG